MKKRLNILCLLVLVVLGWSVIEAGYYLVAGASMGFRAGYAAAEADEQGNVQRLEQMQRMAHMNTVHVLPDFVHNPLDNLMADSVYNEKSGAWVPASYLTLMVSVDTPSSASARALVQPLLALVVLGMGVWALVLFVRLVVAINRSDIFTWRNVRRLRLLGLALVLSYGCNLLSAWLTLCDVEAVFALQGYTLSLSDAVQRTTLVLGISSLIVGEVFAIGLRMREEQELTI